MKKLARWFGAGSKAEANPAPVPTAQPALRGPVDLTAPDFVADPYPTYAAAREHAGLAEVASGGFLLTRYADIRRAVTHPSLGNAPSRFSVLAPRNRAKYTAADLAAHIPPFLDLPEHKLPRQALMRAFTRSFEGFEVALEQEAQTRVAGLSGEVELISGVASPFALASMQRFVGLEAEPATLKRITAGFFHLFAPITDPAAFAETNAGLDDARALFHAALEARRARPGADLLSNLLAFQAEHDALSDAQIVDCAILVFADGIENIEAGAASVFALLEAQGATSEEACIREALRLQTPGQIVPRVARESFDWEGTEITAGTPVFLALASANRDGTVFDAPDLFNADRSEEVFTFGMGRHRCIGEALGVAQITALMQALHARGARRAEPGATLDYAPRFGHRWPKALPIVLPGV
ncbi:cytochrome P450 [Primorskyibacter sp. S187A]|uniref:cytochrome P450 n=1 Tax=Primorskyibacter sp. S187A TaxID=3415130 RepID=UPI003C7A3CF7